MGTSEIIALETGARVCVHDRTRSDHAFEGRTGRFVNMVGAFARLHLDCDFAGQFVQVYPKNVEIFTAGR